MRVLLFALLALLPPARADAEAVRVMVRPEQVYIERASSGRLLNLEPGFVVVRR